MNRLRPVHYLMIAPAQLMLAAVILLPAASLLWLSLERYTYGRAPEFVGLANYAYILADRAFWRATLNTFLVVNVIVYGELLLGLGLALLVAGWIPCRRLVVSALLAPYAITEVSAVVMWRYMLEPDIGMINYALTALGLGQIDYGGDPVAALCVAAVMAIWLHAPFTFLIVYAALLTVPNELVEAARVDGAGAWQVFRHVKFRLIVPAILIALLFRYITAMRLFAEIWLLTEGGPARMTEVLAVYLYRQAFKYHEFGVAAATGFAMLILSLAIAMPYLVQMYRRMVRDAV